MSALIQVADDLPDVVDVPNVGGQWREHVRLDGAIRTNRLRVVNDAGAWEGTLDFIQIDDVDLDIGVGWLVGEDAYEGLMAYVVVDFADDGRIHGHITPEGPPPAPDSVPEQ